MSMGIVGGGGEEEEEDLEWCWEDWLSWNSVAITTLIHHYTPVHRDKFAASPCLWGVRVSFSVSLGLFVRYNNSCFFSINIFLMFTH